MTHRQWMIAAMAVLAMACGIASAQVVRPDLDKTKSSDSLRDVFKSVTAAANRCTVLVKSRVGAEGAPNGVQLAFGTIVSADGYILTKASEVVGQPLLTVFLGDDGKVRKAAKIVGLSEPQDLAMLKIEGESLTPIEWADLKSDKIEVGAWVATAGPVWLEQQDPVAVGVVSVGRRKIPGRLGFLGILRGDTPDSSGARVEQVISGSAAEKAGLHVGDVVSAINGKAIKDGNDLALAVGVYRPGDVVTMTVKHGAEEKTMTATLGANAEEDFGPEEKMMTLLGGAVSKRASDFPAVFQHDTVMRPMDCGGPLVDLTGKVIGINIARAGRTETYALPADVVVPLLGALESGRLAPVNANAPGAKSGGKPTTRPERGE